MRNKITSVIAALGTAAIMSATANAGTLDDVKKRGALRCVVSTGIAGFAYPDKSGVWKGFDVDFCRATAAAVLGDAKRLKLSRQQVRPALPSSIQAKVMCFGVTPPSHSRVMSA